MPWPDDPAMPWARLTLIDYWGVMWRARWWITAMVVVAAAVAFGVARLQPKVYTARATILQPKESAGPSLSTSLGALLGGGGGRDGGGGGFFSVPGLSLGVASSASNQDVYVAMVKSRVLRKEVLEAVEKSWSQPVVALVVSVTPDLREKGVVGLTVEAKHPQLAAEVANEYFVHLDGMLERYAEDAIKKKEAIYTTQLERAAREVDAAEQALLKFQSENRFIAVDAPTRAQVDAVVNLRSTIMALEMQREVMRLRFTDEHPQMRELQKQIAELKRQYSKNLFGEPMDLPPEGPSARSPRKEFFVSASKMTPVQFASLKLFRNLKIQEAFYTGALQGLQQIKYGDGAYQQSVQFLDRATPPEAPSRPNIPVIVLVAAGSAFVAGILLAFLVEYVRWVRAEQRRALPPGSGRGRRGENGPERSRLSELEGVRGVQPAGLPPGRAVPAAREGTE